MLGCRLGNTSRGTRGHGPLADTDSVSFCCDQSPVFLPTCLTTPYAPAGAPLKSNTGGLGHVCEAGPGGGGWVRRSTPTAPPPTPPTPPHRSVTLWSPMQTLGPMWS